MKKWQFDENYINNLLDRGFALLRDPEIPNDKKIRIRQDIKFFQEILKQNFEYFEKPEEYFPSLEDLKRYVINKMRKQYELFGRKLINGIIALDNESIFDISDSFEQTDLSMDEQEKLTMRNYEKNSKFLLNYARGLFSSKPTSQIQCVENLNSSSYCYPSEIDNLPFLIVNPTEMPSILNHEVQHGVEDILGFNHPRFLSEEGSIFFELLYLDILFEEQNYLLRGDIHRLNETSIQINYLSGYFEVMKEFARKNFQVSKSEFLEMFGEYFNVMKGNLGKALNDEIVSGEIDKDIMYLLSHLKAIKLRHYSKLSHDDAFEVLKSHVKTPIFESDNLTSDFEIYEEYINEMLQKSRKGKLN